MAQWAEGLPTTSVPLIPAKARTDAATQSAALQWPEGIILSEVANV